MLTALWTHVRFTSEVLTRTVIFYRLRQTQLHQLTLGLWTQWRGCHFSRGLNLTYFVWPLVDICNSTGFLRGLQAPENQRGAVQKRGWKVQSPFFRRGLRIRILWFACVYGILYRRLPRLRLGVTGVGLGDPVLLLLALLEPRAWVLHGTTAHLTGLTLGKIFCGTCRHLPK